ncbi:MAG: site-2 protease family protein [Lachnospira sp.]
MIVHPPGISKQYAGFVVFFSIAVFIMSLMMHELGHTMIAISRGVCVSEIGIGIKEGIFLAYTKMLQLEKLEKKKDKICICFGGILMNVFLLSVALIINGLWWESIILKIVICVNLLVTLFNFSIYFHSDGADVLKCLLASKADSNESSNVKYIVAFSAVLYNLILPVTVIVCFVLRNM